MTTHRSFITFDEACVNAIMAGTKTQMRRVVRDTGLYAIDAAIHGQATADRELANLATQCPYGVPGGVLRVIQPRNLTLHITAVRVERLQAITEDDAIAEGIKAPTQWHLVSHRLIFKSMWDARHLQNSHHTWDQDPWVYVICFRKG